MKWYRPKNGRYLQCDKNINLNICNCGNSMILDIEGHSNSFCEITLSDSIQITLN